MLKKAKTCRFLSSPSLQKRLVLSVWNSRRQQEMTLFLGFDQHGCLSPCYSAHY